MKTFKHQCLALGLPTRMTALRLLPATSDGDSTPSGVRLGQRRGQTVSRANIEARRSTDFTTDFLPGGVLHHA